MKLLEKKKIKACGIDSGSLFPLELKDLFQIRRMFWVTGVPENDIRGKHAHIKCKQIYLCVSGFIRVRAVDINGTIDECLLEQGEYVVIDKGIWTSEQYLSDKTDVLLVLASEHYDTSDYSEKPVSEEQAIIGGGNFSLEVSDVFGDVCVIAIQKADVRARVFEEWKDKIKHYDTPIHRTAFISKDAVVCEGSIVMQYACVSNGSDVGRFCVIDKHSCVGHGTKISDFSTLAPGAIVAGNCKIGSRVYIGSGATVRERTTICDDVTIGMGAAVVSSITEPGTYIGVPARKMEKL